MLHNASLLLELLPDALAEVEVAGVHLDEITKDLAEGVIYGNLQINVERLDVVNTGEAAVDDMPHLHIGGMILVGETGVHSREHLATLQLSHSGEDLGKRRGSSLECSVRKLVGTCGQQLLGKQSH